MAVVWKKLVFEEDVVLKGWLPGWEKRVPFVISKDDIDENLTHFAVLVHLSATCGIDNAYDMTPIFDELESDDNRFKIAITKADGTTQIYAEIEKWDDANEEAWLHISKSDWIVLTAENTPIFIYYDSTHADNDDYVGDTNSAPAESVWDANFKAVYHMADGADNAHIYDSTSNNNDGAKEAANDPVEADGDIGKAQDFFVGDADKIAIGDIGNLTNLTVEVYVNSDAVENYRNFIAVRGIADEVQWRFQQYTTGVIRWYQENLKYIDSTLIAGSWHYFAGVSDADGLYIYKNGSLVASDPTYGQADSLSTDVYLGTGWDGSDARSFDGKICETRISDVARSAAWLKATNESLNDNLITFGKEETWSNYHAAFHEAGGADQISLAQLVFGTVALDADADHRGMFYFIEGGAGVADKLYIIMKGTDDNYSAIQVAIG